MIRIGSKWHRIKHYVSGQYQFLSKKFSSFSSNKEVDVLLGLKHLRGPLHANHSSQPLGIELGVEDSASPGGFLPSAGGSQHVTDFTVEVGICWQFIENQVPDPFYGIPIRRGKRGYIYWRKFMQKLPKRVRQARSSRSAPCSRRKIMAHHPTDQRLF